MNEYSYLSYILFIEYPRMHSLLLKKVHLPRETFIFLTKMNLTIQAAAILGNE